MLRTGVAFALLLAGAARAGEEEAIRRVRELGGQVVVRPTGEVWVELAGTRAGDGDLEALADINRLTLVNLNGTRVTDAGMKALVGLRRLKTLWLPNTAVTDVGMIELARHGGLKCVELRGTAVTAAGAAELQKTMPRCEAVITRASRRARANPAPGPAVPPACREARDVARFKFLGGRAPRP